MCGHMVEALELGSVIFECKEGPFVEQDAEGILKGYGLKVNG